MIISQIKTRELKPKTNQLIAIDKCSPIIRVPLGFFSVECMFMLLNR